MIEISTFNVGMTIDSEEKRGMLPSVNKNPDYYVKATRYETTDDGVRVIRSGVIFIYTLD